MTRTKAFRRHQRTRVQRRRAGHWGGYASADAKRAGMIASTPCMCSSWCCGNPRNHAKGEARMTMQERRAVA